MPLGEDTANAELMNKESTCIWLPTTLQCGSILCSLLVSKELSPELCSYCNSTNAHKRLPNDHSLSPFQFYHHSRPAILRLTLPQKPFPLHHLPLKLNQKDRLPWPQLALLPLPNTMRRNPGGKPRTITSPFNNPRNKCRTI